MALRLQCNTGTDVRANTVFFVFSVVDTCSEIYFGEMEESFIFITSSCFCCYVSVSFVNDLSCVS